MRILLVRLRLIGDVVFTTPIVRALRRVFPDAELTYLVEHAAAPVVATNTHLSHVIAIAHSRGWRRVRDDAALAWRLRASKFDVAVDLHGGPRSAWLAWASRAPVRVGYDIPGRAWMYTRVVHRARDAQPRHSVENQWDLLPAIDASLTAPADPDRDRVEMPVDPAARASIANRLAAFGLPAWARIVAVHVRAGEAFRQWPEPAFAELAAGLLQRDGSRWLVLIGGPADRDAIRRVASAVHGPAADRIRHADGWSLAEVRALMERAALFIGVDSGPLHVASTSDVPIVGLYGPTLSARSAPWRPRNIPTASIDTGPLSCRPCDQRVCAPGDFRCWTRLPVSAVHDAAERLLEIAE